MRAKRRRFAPIPGAYALCLAAYHGGIQWRRWPGLVPRVWMCLNQHTPNEVSETNSKNKVDGPTVLFGRHDANKH